MLPVAPKTKVSALTVTLEAFDAIGLRQKPHCPYLLRVAWANGCRQCGHQLRRTSAISSLTISSDHQAQLFPCHANALHFSDHAHTQFETQPPHNDFQKHLKLPTIPTAQDVLYLRRHKLIATNRSC